MGRNCLSILMIDDNPAHADLLERKLRDDSVPWAVDVTSALTLEKALKALDRNRFDLFVVDYQFPFGNGFTVLDRLREKGHEAPAIMLTGQGNENVAAQAVKKNLEDYLPKDKMTTDNLQTAIENALTGALVENATATISSSPRSMVRLEPGTSLLATLSSVGDFDNDLSLYLMGPVHVSPGTGSAKHFPLTEKFLETVFHEIALEPLSFYKIRHDLVAWLYRKPRQNLLTLDESRRSLSSRLAEFSQDFLPQSLRGESIRGPVCCLLEVSDRYDDPAEVVNGAFDVYDRIDPDNFDPNASVPKETLTFHG